MPKNLTGNSALFPAQTSPVAGEPRTSGSIETPLQNAADRSQFVYDRMMFVDPTRDGVRRLRRFATIADMKAATDLTDGGTALVDGVGLYEYSASSTAAELSPVAIKPTTVGGGSGAWLVAGVGSGMLNVPNGVPQLDGAAKVPTSRLAASDTDGRIVAGVVRNGIVNVYSAAFGGPYETTSTSYTEAFSFTMNLLVGDRVVVMGQGYIWQYNLSADTNHWTQWFVTASIGTPVAITESEYWVRPFGDHVSNALPVCVNYTAASPGLHTFSLRQRGNPGGGTVAVSNASIAAIQVRP